MTLGQLDIMPSTKNGVLYSPPNLAYKVCQGWEANPGSFSHISLIFYDFTAGLQLIHISPPNLDSHFKQGTLTEGEGSVQLISSFR
jgi:hypothetical protein